MRLFVALLPDRASRESLIRMRSRFAHRLEGVRWVPIDNWHLTLHFIGATDPNSARALAREAEGLDKAFALQHPDGIEAAATGLGGFPDPDTAGRVWALHVAQSATVDEWHCRWREALAGCGFDTASAARFLPHLSLARASRQMVWPSQPLPLELHFDRLALMESRPARSGAMPRYVPLSSDSVSSGTS